MRPDAQREKEPRCRGCARQRIAPDPLNPRRSARRRAASTRALDSGVASSALRTGARAPRRPPGDYRVAAGLYVEATRPRRPRTRSSSTAARAATIEERLAAYQDALRWLPADHPRRKDVEAQIGLAVLEDARKRGGATARRARRASTTRPSGSSARPAPRRRDGLGASRSRGRRGALSRRPARSSASSSLLDQDVGRGRPRARRLRATVQDYEMSMAGGARLEAHAALRQALAVAPHDASSRICCGGSRPACRHRTGSRLVVESARRDDCRWRAALRCSGARARTFALRGVSVSRRHAELYVDGVGLVVRDLDSRNGTLVGGVAIA